MNSFEPASFRDPGGRIVVKDNRIYRELTSSGVKIWNDLLSTGLLDEMANRGHLVKTWEAKDFPSSAPKVLEHARVPVITYAYEWPVTLLKRAALLHLDLLLELLPKGFILKDSTPYNVQFVGTKPVFIDLLSIERLVEGDPWAGYGQFCDTMLYPLMLEKYKGIPYQDWLRGTMQGIRPEFFGRLFGWADIFKGGVLMHVKLRSMLHKKFQDPESMKRNDIRAAKLPVSSILHNVRGLKSLVESLGNPHMSGSHWATYTETNTYSDEARVKKKEFVDRFLSQTKPDLTWDIGCNTGDFSAIAAKHSKQVLSFDNDPDVVDILVQRCENEKISNVLPLVMDFSNPSPSLGWAGKERKSIFDRERPNVTLALAVIHHLAVRGNVPLEEQVKLFARMSEAMVIEYVDREDPMFKKLITNVGIEHENYNRDEFLRSLNAHFTVLQSERLSATREIFAVQSKYNVESLRPKEALAEK